MSIFSLFSICCGYPLQAASQAFHYYPPAVEYLFFHELKRKFVDLSLANVLIKTFMKSNPYHVHLKKLFSRLIELRHTVYQVDTVLKDSVTEYKFTNQNDFQSMSSLIISDWTGPTDSGWALFYGTGFSKVTYKKDYKKEIQRIISLECAYSFAQCFEALETFLKDCVFVKIHFDKKYLTKLKQRIRKDFDRKTFHGGEKLYSAIKLACNNIFQTSSEKNNRNIKFREFWSTISIVRHSITHSGSKIKIDDFQKSKYHFAIFKYFFNYSKIDKEIIKVEFDSKKFEGALRAIAEYAYQIFKSLSITDGFKFNILRP